MKSVRTENYAVESVRTLIGIFVRKLQKNFSNPNSSALAEVVSLMSDIKKFRISEITELSDLNEEIKKIAVSFRRELMLIEMTPLPGERRISGTSYSRSIFDIEKSKKTEEYRSTIGKLQNLFYFLMHPDVREGDKIDVDLYKSISRAVAQQIILPILFNLNLRSTNKQNVQLGLLINDYAEPASDRRQIMLEKDLFWVDDLSHSGMNIISSIFRNSIPEENLLNFLFGIDKIDERSGRTYLAAEGREYVHRNHESVTGYKSLIRLFVGEWKIADSDAEKLENGILSYQDRFGFTAMINAAKHQPETLNKIFLTLKKLYKIEVKENGNLESRDAEGLAEYRKVIRNLLEQVNRTHFNAINAACADLKYNSLIIIFDELKEGFCADKNSGQKLLENLFCKAKFVNIFSTLLGINVGSADNSEKRNNAIGKFSNLVKEIFPDAEERKNFLVEAISKDSAFVAEIRHKQDSDFFEKLNTQFDLEESMMLSSHDFIPKVTVSADRGTFGLKDPRTL